MAVNLRKKYYGNPKLANKRRPYKFQLDYQLNGKRTREVIKAVKFLPTDSIEQRKLKERIVNKIKAELEIDLANQTNGLISRKLQKANFIDFFKKLAESKSPNTRIAWNNTLKHMIKFHGKRLKFEDINEHWLLTFEEYLKQHLETNSIRTYLQKVSTALNHAVKQKIILENPYKYVSKPKREETEMVYLNEEEVQMIADIDFFDKNIQFAFLLSCFTGLRFSDLKALKWVNIEENQIRLTQTKTKSSVYIPLNKNAKEIIGKMNKKYESVFKLSEHNGSANRTLRKLIERTEITKKVSFHTARHTFATLLVTSGTNIYTVSKLLGHTDIKSTLIYAKVINQEKERAVNSIPEIKI